MIARRPVKTAPIAHAGPEAVGLERDDVVRWKYGKRHLYGLVRHVERDGSVALIACGQFRPIPADRLEVERRGPRGGRRWEPVQ